LRSEILSEIKKTKEIARTVEYDDAKALNDLVKETNDFIRQIDYNTYRAGTKRLLSLIEMNEMIGSN